MSDLQDDLPAMPAAEYVLGTLDAAEAQAARALVERDPVFAAEVRDWERMLLPLSALALPAEPLADLWDRIEASTRAAPSASAPILAPALAQAAPPRAANDNRVGFWRAAALASMAVAASLAAFLILRPVPAPVFAVLSPTGSTAAVLIAFTQPGGGVQLRPSGDISVAAGRDLQLWSLPVGATKPASLGLLRGGGALLPPGIAPGTKLLVSVEPAGGSRTGLPTGPVVYGGVLTRF